MTIAKAYLQAYPEVTLEFIAANTHNDLLGSRIDVALGEVGNIHS